MAHEDGGRLPMDFGSTAETAIHASCVEQLREHYDPENRPVKIF